MRCPYHPNEDAELTVPEGASAPGGWIGWLEGCCGLPAWRCDRGALHPVDAMYCTYHGCERPLLDRVTHEVAAGEDGCEDVAAPGLLQRELAQAPAADGRSTPALAGNILVYLTAGGTLVAVDFGGEGRIALASDLQSATLRLRRGEVIGALSNAGGLRYLAWRVRDLRDAMADTERRVAPRAIEATGVHLLGLPAERTRLHQGTGLLRLVVEHDPVDDALSEVYEAATGAPPGAFLVRRTTNPAGPQVAHPDLRPQLLQQVPVPVPGGTFLLGRLRWFGESYTGALLVPTVAGYVAHA